MVTETDQTDTEEILPSSAAFRAAVGDFQSYLYTRIPDLLGDAYLAGDAAVLTTTDTAAYLLVAEDYLDKLLRDWRRARTDAEETVKLAHRLEVEKVATTHDVDLRNLGVEDVMMSATADTLPENPIGLAVPFRTPAPKLESIPPATLSWREIMVGTAQLAIDIESNETEALSAYFVYTRLLAQDITPHGAYHRLTEAFGVTDDELSALLDTAADEITASTGAPNTEYFAARYHVPEAVASILREWWSTTPETPLVDHDALTFSGPGTDS
ncbi:hypothetical protein [Salinibaculum rarum]|uniref:hypothetical protein n=1 Tax=Salinibaculum rarum TaxID=3058903 RepID=UPI00265E512A|nr:hypothetical protein [Salinibaculum sp. KK48]